MKKRSKIIIDIINENVNIAQAFEVLDLLLEDMDDSKIKSWVSNEINGYGKDEEIPEYRKVPASIIGTVNTPRMVVTKYNIPVPLDIEEMLCNVEIKDGVNKIIQMSEAEKELENHCLCLPLDLVLINSVAKINGEVTHANRQLSLYAYTNILGKLKTKLLSIFKELERNYGNLDDYYIEFEDAAKEKETVKNITNIIYDNSVKIGDGNTIDKSIIGDDNND